jgi:hypothetical protein
VQASETLDARDIRRPRLPIDPAESPLFARISEPERLPTPTVSVLSNRRSFRRTLNFSTSAPAPFEKTARHAGFLVLCKLLDGDAMRCLTERKRREADRTAKAPKLAYSEDPPR